MTDDLDAHREYDRVPECGLTDDQLDKMVVAALTVRQERMDLNSRYIAQGNKMPLGSCACLGPRPFCRCTRHRLKIDIAAAVAALIMGTGS